MIKVSLSEPHTSIMITKVYKDIQIHPMFANVYAWKYVDQKLDNLQKCFWLVSSSHNELQLVLGNIPVVPWNRGIFVIPNAIKNTIIPL